MRNRRYFPLYFSGEFLSTVYTTFKNFPISPLIKRHCIQCNAYTLKLTCTVNLSRLSHVAIQVTLLLINTKIFNVILNILLNSIENSSQVTNKIAATSLLKAREIFKFTKQPVLLFVTVRILKESKKQKSCMRKAFLSKFKVCLNVK